MNPLDDKHPLHNVKFVLYEELDNPIDEYPSEPDSREETYRHLTTLP